MNSGTFVINDETGWESITSESCTRGRIVEHNILKEKSGPTSYAKRNIEKSYAVSSGRLLLDEPICFVTSKIVQRKKLTGNWEKMNGQQL
ncbi:hypothetical protein TNCV_1097661 [Trichonephila clavipes]|nr:hypothetical protein TNCV_1097661 [Trichonephila clavipes]